MTAAGKHLSVLNYDYTRDICIKVLSFHFVGMKTELTKEPSCHKLSFRDISWRAGDTQTDRRTGWLSDEETCLVSSSSSSHFQLREHLLNIFIPLTSLPERLTWRFLSSQQVKNGKKQLRQQRDDCASRLHSYIPWRVSLFRIQRGECFSGASVNNLITTSPSAVWWIHFLLWRRETQSFHLCCVLKPAGLQLHQRSSERTFLPIWYPPNFPQTLQTDLRRCFTMTSSLFFGRAALHKDVSPQVRTGRREDGS